MRRREIGKYYPALGESQPLLALAPELRQYSGLRQSGAYANLELAGWESYDLESD